MDRQKVLAELSRIRNLQTQLDYHEAGQAAKVLLRKGKKSLTASEVDELKQFEKKADSGMSRLFKDLGLK